MLIQTIYSRLTQRIPKGIVLFWARFYVLTSFITKTYGEAGQGVAGRFTFPDLVALVGLIILLGKKFLFPPLMAGFIMIFAFTIGMFTSLAVDVTVFEIIIHIFLMFSVVLLYNAYRNNIALLIQDIATVTIIAGSIGLLDFFASGLGLPRIFSARADGEVVSGFRNAGQAGAYVLVCLTILIPAAFSEMSQIFKKKQLLLIKIGIGSGMIFLLSTGKIAAYIGIVFGFLFFNLFRRRLLPLFFTLVFGIIGYFAYENLDVISPTMNNRLKAKVESRVTKNINGEVDPTKEGFIAHNVGNAMEAFVENPYTGTGLGAFAGAYERHEVHSTYFKMIGETGILGVIGYSIFMIFFIGKVRSYKKYPVMPGITVNPFADYLKNLWPFLLGCLVSWAYSYHLRKREFWILFIVVILCELYARLYEKTKRIPVKYVTAEPVNYN